MRDVQDRLSAVEQKLQDQPDKHKTLATIPDVKAAAGSTASAAEGALVNSLADRLSAVESRLADSSKPAAGSMDASVQQLQQQQQQAQAQLQQQQQANAVSDLEHKVSEMDKRMQQLTSEQQVKASSSLTAGATDVCCAQRAGLTGERVVSLLSHCGTNMDACCVHQSFKLHFHAADNMLHSWTNPCLLHHIHPPAGAASSVQQAVSGAVCSVRKDRCPG